MEDYPHAKREADTRIMNGLKVPGVVWTLAITIAVALIHENLTGQYALYGDAIVAALLAIGKVLEVNQPAPPMERMILTQPSKNARFWMG